MMNKDSIVPIETFLYTKRLISMYRSLIRISDEFRLMGSIELSTFNLHKAYGVESSINLLKTIVYGSYFELYTFDEFISDIESMDYIAYLKCYD